MSFWPFSNPYGSSSHLQKFLDGISDLSSVTVDQLFEDKNLQQELLDELKTISSKTLKSNTLSFAQSLSNEAQTKNSAANGASDTLSLTSSNADSNSGGSLSKTAREQKLIELLLQPHILTGFLDYLVLSVDFFHESMGASESDVTESVEDVDIGAPELSKIVKQSEEEPRFEKLQRCISCSAEILSTDLWVISNRIIETPSLMGKLWSVLSLPNLQESSPSLAYLIQVLGHLMDSNCIELTNFIRRQQALADTFLNKIDIPVLMDFFLKIIQTDKADSPSGILNVLARQNMVPKLLDILRPELLEDSEFNPDILADPKLLFKQTAATEFIKALVAISSNPTLAVDLETNIGPNELTRELASPEIMTIMLNDIMLYRVHTKNGPVANKHGIHNCVSILIELIRKNNSDYDSNCGTYTQNEQHHDGSPEINVHTMCLWLKDLNQNPPGPRDPIYLGDLLRIFSDGLSDLVGVVEDEEKRSFSSNNTLGLTRFKIAELVAELLHCSNMILLNSSKVASLVAARDKIRNLRAENLRAAIAEAVFPEADAGENLSGRMNESVDENENESVDDIVENAENTVNPLFHITDGLDTISLEQLETSRDSKATYSLADRQHRNSVDNFSLNGLEEEEPSVSNENPFVCEERNRSFRENPCVGDRFKIELLDSRMLTTIVRQLTQYPWHNFFHNVVFDLVQQVFNGKLNSYNSFLIVELFEGCTITETIADAFRTVVNPRPGYMGHLVLVSEEVVKFASLYKPSLISPVIVAALGSQSWEWFVSEVLLKTRELYNVVLGTDPDYSQDENGTMDEDEGGYCSWDVSDQTRNGNGENGENGEHGQNGQNDQSRLDGDGINGQRTSNHAIILGDSSNHEDFVREENGDISEDEADLDGEDNEENEENDENRRKILDVSIKSMSPNAEFENKDMLYEEFAGHKINFDDDKYLDDFPGSSSSDEETDNQLYRVGNNGK